QRILHLAVHVARYTMRWCSTPIGVKGFSTIRATSTKLVGRKCSTPIGVKGFSTRRAPGPSRGRWGAQRLSASKDSPLDLFRMMDNYEIKCSTPIGVKGFSTGLGRG